jgi:hypothetical protein
MLAATAASSGEQHALSAIAPAQHGKRGAASQRNSGCCIQLAATNSSARPRLHHVPSFVLLAAAAKASARNAGCSRGERDFAAGCCRCGLPPASCICTFSLQSLGPRAVGRRATNAPNHSLGTARERLECADAPNRSLGVRGSDPRQRGADPSLRSHARGAGRKLDCEDQHLVTASAQ